MRGKDVARGGRDSEGSDVEAKAKPQSSTATQVQLLAEKSNPVHGDLSRRIACCIEIDREH